MEVNLGQLDLQSNEAVQNAINNVTAAQQAMAEFYQGTMDKVTTSSTNKYGIYNDESTTQTSTFK